MNVFSATTQRLPLQAERDAVGRARRPSGLLEMDVRRAVHDGILELYLKALECDGWGDVSARARFVSLVAHLSS